MIFCKPCVTCVAKCALWKVRFQKRYAYFSTFCFVTMDFCFICLHLIIDCVKKFFTSIKKCFTSANKCLHLIIDFLYRRKVFVVMVVICQYFLMQVIQPSVNPQKRLQYYGYRSSFYDLLDHPFNCSKHLPPYPYVEHLIVGVNA